MGAFQLGEQDPLLSNPAGGASPAAVAHPPQQAATKEQAGRAYSGALREVRTVHPVIERDDVVRGGLLGGGGDASITQRDGSKGVPFVELAGKPIPDLPRRAHAKVVGSVAALAPLVLVRVSCDRALRDSVSPAEHLKVD